MQNAVRRKNRAEAAGGDDPVPYSDCRGAIFKVNNRHKWRKMGSEPLFSFLGVIDAVVGEAGRSIQWVKGHPEREITDMTKWSRQQWGIGLADFYADREDGELGGQRANIHTVSRAELEDLVRACAPYHFASTCPQARVIFTGLCPAKAGWEKEVYCARRNGYREERQLGTKWSPARLALALRAGNLGSRRLVARKVRVKWIFDWFWHCGNAAKGRYRDGDLDDVVTCELCEDGQDGVTHIVKG